MEQGAVEEKGGEGIHEGTCMHARHAPDVNKAVGLADLPAAAPVDSKEKLWKQQRILC